MISDEERFNAYEQMMRTYLGSELVLNVYEREKLINKDFAKKEKQIYDALNRDIKEMLQDNVKEFCLEMYRQGFRDAIDIMKG